jgi:hypothetical protein
VTTVQYDNPKLTILATAINVIQTTKQFPVNDVDSPTLLTEVSIGAYQDWE